VVVAVLLVVVGPVYDTTRITPNEIQQHVDHLRDNLKLRPIHENNAQINYLDLLITRQTYDLRIDIYRKPTKKNGKPEVATAVDKLLMMGMRMPETC
jgi:hypothetical protein